MITALVWTGKQELYKKGEMIFLSLLVDEQKNLNYNGNYVNEPIYR